MRVYLETMGCQMNRLDSELVASALRAAGHEMVEDVKAADVILFNTCSVRRHAEQKVYSRLGTAGQRKSARPGLIIGVLGCMAQREGAELRRNYPQVDIVCSPDRLAELPAFIARAAAGKPTVALAPPRGAKSVAANTAATAPGSEPEAPAPLLPTNTATNTGDSPQTAGTVPSLPAATRKRAVPLLPTNTGDSPQTAGTVPSLPAATRKRAVLLESVSVADTSADFDELDLSRDPSAAASPSQAFVRVARGCDKFCSYCIVPYVRGPEISRDPRHVVQEVRKLVEAGRCEVTLLGQTVNSYRFAGDGRHVRFSDLLAMVSAVPGLRRLRFVTSHPIDFGDDVLEAMRDLPNVCPYIHAPAQSGSDAVLARMNRKYTRADYDDLVDRARAIVPGVVLAGDFIVGFPGETDDDHAASAALIRRSGYKNSFIFKYSPRPGTLAAKRFTDDVPTDVKKRRNNELLAVQEEVSLAHHRAYVGLTVEVLVEGPSPRTARREKRVLAERGLTPAPSAGVCHLAEKRGQTPPKSGGVSPLSCQLVGRTVGDHIVVFDGPKSLAGQYVQVKIADATSLTLLGRVM